MKSRISICETFYSIQGEGQTAGVPAVFLRLAGCNLGCPGFSYKDPKTGEHLGCDTKAVWQKGKQYAISETIDEWQVNGWIDKLLAGAHLVITGGEPLLQQEALLCFLQQLEQKIYIEIETNGTILFLPEVYARIDQINTSPKLANSGEPCEKRYKPEVLSQLASAEKTRFKFVVSQESDIAEIFANYVEPFNISPSRVWLMPEGATAQEINKKSTWIIELCKKYSMNFSPRLQIVMNIK
jgi:7-carboxy-7-deazaguanine synthase